MRALVTGCLGQDGSYLVEQLVAAGHEVFGLTRRPNAVSPATLIVGDLLDQDSLNRAVVQAKPDVVFNLAAVLDPGGGWSTSAPLMTEVTGLGAVRLLEAVVRHAPDAKVVHASSSAVLEPERYGLYGAAKRLAHDAVVGYRDRVWASNAILFSHTSPRKDPRFLDRRICTTLARGGTVTLTDLHPRRDWGYAPDYCEALQAVAAAPEPGDWVVATGRSRSVADLVAVALEACGRSWDAVRIEGRVGYPDEISTEGMCTVRELGWSPRTSFEDIIRELVEVAR